MIIAGAGGFGREVLGYLREAIAHQPGVRFKGILDDDPSAGARLVELDAPYLGPINDYQPQLQDRFVVAIGTPDARSRVILDMQSRGARFFSVIHPTAHIAATAIVGTGCIIAPHCAIGNQVRLADHVVLTWFASVSHDSTVERFAAFSPYSTVNGSVTIGEGAFLGTRATVNPLLAVGAWAKVAAGAVVYRDVPAEHLAIGNPARATPMLRRPGASYQTDAEAASHDADDALSDRDQSRVI